jgi:hypothetical protein
VEAQAGDLPGNKKGNKEVNKWAEIIPAAGKKGRNSVNT